MIKETEDCTQLVKDAAEGKVDALEKLLKKTEKQVYSLLFYLSKSENELNDMVQEILLKITKNIKNLKEPSSYKSWLNKIVLREYYDNLRKCKTKPVVFKNDITECAETENIADSKREPIEDCIGCELAKIIKDSILKLSEPYKAAILMREFEGFSYDEIAKMTNTNVGTVKSRIARARCRLKEYIKPYMEQK